MNSCYSMGESWKHVTWNKPDTQKNTNIIWFHVYEVAQTGKSIESESRMLCTRGGGMGSYCLVDTEFLFEMMKKFWVWMCLMSLNYPLKMVKMIYRIVQTSLARHLRSIPVWPPIIHNGKGEFRFWISTPLCYFQTSGKSQTFLRVPFSIYKMSWAYTRKSLAGSSTSCGIFPWPISLSEHLLLSFAQNSYHSQRCHSPFTTPSLLSPGTRNMIAVKSIAYGISCLFST